MAARRQRTTRRGFRPSPSWAGVASAAYTVLPAASKVLVTSFVPTLTDVGETVRRTRGHLSVGTDQAAAIEEQIGALGAGVFSDTAIAAGITALPDPITNIGDEFWFVYQPFIRKGMDSSAAAPTFTEYMIDSKAMRKVPPGYSVAIIMANAHATFGLEWAVNLRILGSTTSA